MIFEKPSTGLFGVSCSHEVVVVSVQECGCDPHSSSSYHHGICPICKEWNSWEPNQHRFAVYGSTLKPLEKMSLNFEDLFEYGKQYTEEEIIIKLVEVYKPKYIYSGRRRLYPKS